MRLSHVELRRAPGVPGPLVLHGLAPGLNLVVGPNASGKSTLRRAVHACLWPQEGEVVELVATWAHGDRALGVTLAHGRAEWSPERPALPDASATGSYVLTIQDLLRAGGADRAIARELRIELSGGYDLDAARRAFAPNARAPRALVQAVKQARAALARAERDADALGRREEELAGLRAEADAARRAAAGLRRVELAEERLRVQERRDAAARGLAGLPAAAGRVDGGELRLLDERVEEERAQQERAARARRERQAVERRLGELAFPGPEPPAEEIDAWRARLEALRQVQGRLEHAAREASASAARERQLRAGVFGGHAVEGRVDPAWLDALEALSGRRRALLAAEAAERTSVNLLEDLLASTPDGDPDALAARAHALRAWLALSEVERRPPAWRRALARACLVLGLLLLVAGAVGGGWPLVAAGAAVAGLGVGLWLGGARAAGDRERLEAEGSRGGEGPVAWEPGAVREALIAVERRVADARLVERARARLEQARRQEAAHRAERARDEAERVSRVEALGLAPDLVGLPLVVQARRIVALLDARAELAEREQRRLDLEREGAEGLARFSAWLEGHGAAPCRDVAEAGARLDALAARLAELRGARSHADRLDEVVREAEAQAAAARRRRLTLLEHAGVADRAELAEAVRHRERFAALGEALRACDARLSELEPRVGDLGALDAPALAARREALEAQSARYEGLVERIKGIEAAVEAATGGRTLEDARAALADAEAALAAARDASWEEAVALWLADRVGSEQEAAHAPPVLRRARAWFARFTQGAFELELGADGFTARDTRTGALRALDELSDATRIQLLLAARVAHVEALEGDGPALPLLLDEVLSTTDPSRFRAIAEALLELAAAGRQVVYLTADLDEAAAWVEACRALGHPEPRLFDLGEAGAARPAEALPPVEPAPAPPSPEGLDAHAYARRLGVPAPDGFLPAEGWHLWYLLHDDLPALHRCLSAGLTTVGRWSAVARHGDALLAPEAEARLRRRARLLEALLERWRRGRARPLRWDDVLAADVVTPAFEADLQRLAARHATDAAAFLEAVAALPRFRRQRLAQLGATLRERGLLPDEPPLSHELLRAEAAVQAVVVGEPDAAWATWIASALAPEDAPADA